MKCYLRKGLIGASKDMAPPWNIDINGGDLTGVWSYGKGKYEPTITINIDKIEARRVTLARRKD